MTSPGPPARRRPHVAVVGGGFAGMGAALWLAARGARVTLIEREPRLGGKAGEWRVGAYRFDTGPSVLTLPEVVRSTFEGAGVACPVTFRPAAPLCRYVYPDGRVWDVHRDLDATLAGLSAAEGEAYRRALAKARTLYEAAAPVFVHGPAPGPLRLLRYALRHGAAAAPGRSLPALLRALGADGPLLGPFFQRFATYVGADPRRAPAVLHNVAWVELGLGVYHPVGGMYGVVRALRAALLELGVELRLGEAVERLTVREGALREVVTEHGALACDGAVTAVDRDVVLRWLGRSQGRARPASLSGLVLLSALEARDPRLAHHTIVFPERYGDEFDAIHAGEHPRDPTLYVNVSALSEAGDAPEGAENRFVMANAPALPLHDDPERRAARLEAGREALLRSLQRRGFAWPASQVVSQRWLDPSDFAAFGDRGRLYGAAPHGLLGALRPAPRLRGLRGVVLAGGTVHPGGGVPLALLSGRAAARALGDAVGLPLLPSMAP